MAFIQEALPIIVHSFLGLAGVVGLVALMSPKMFAVLAETSGLWVAAPKAATIDKNVIDIDQFVIKNSRQFGALMNRADKALYAAKQAGRNQGYRHDGAACEPITANELLATIA